jgi:transcriptional regulator with XRE-family HTH domain
MKNQFGRKLRAVREGAGKSLQDVADVAGITKNHVWDMEQGRSTNPTIETLCGLAKALGVNAETLCYAAIADRGAPLSIHACEVIRENR